MPLIQVNGTTIYYEMTGSGLPIVFIHDYSTSHLLFEPQAEYFSKRAKVIVFDLRGNGKSGKMDVEISRIVDTQCEDLKVLLDALSIDRAVIVASSSGTVLAQKYASSYPERVINLILVDSYFSSGTTALGGKVKGFLEICAWASHYLPAEMFIRSLRITYNNWLVAYHILKKELIQQRTTELIKQRLALRNTDVYGFALQLQIPVLCVSGNRNDWVLEQVRKTASQYPLAQFSILEDAIYPSHLCQPERFNRLLLDYLLDQQCFQMADPDRMETLMSKSDS
ncbi:alpha/beta fold hydrolase [Paenibacillus typhae]|uniref:Pimeloyl-ACP methyl ester carboxylesterase n=1 Tax=Paenibacillus typhae TaxID=1174501 RepID=A0A1G8GN27_9BACL|nr:alpha/beta hydrolase [Paenibacillus typhae]SDH95727.1 Pimeloyl-ACP methyl ester carboxylesterase [Paenibacillus typhae]